MLIGYLRDLFLQSLLLIVQHGDHPVMLLRLVALRLHYLFVDLRLLEIFVSLRVAKHSFRLAQSGVQLDLLDRGSFLSVHALLRHWSCDHLVAI